MSSPIPERIEELEAEVREARLVIACLVHLAGGQVDIPEELVVSVRPDTLVSEMRRMSEGGVRLSLRGRVS
ncbi:hypothetical protein [Nonomuraea sp. NPDC049750]|uniref:hypothetical protein n=1 Tax=Nonomuraea sp. NPDC049750 TaxID=3154738 RepID=UPI0033EC1C2A